MEQVVRDNVGGRVLVVCTANVCRSPYIAGRLRELLSGLPITVTSRGTRALTGQPMDLLVSAALGDDTPVTTDFTARQLTSADLDEADLVITAAREHRADAVRLNPRAMARCFTLRDLADLAAAASPSAVGSVPPDTSWVQHVTARLAARRGLVPTRASNDADVADPTGLGARAYDRMFGEVDRVLPVVAAALTPVTEVTSRRR